jgi:hypothetical protein
MGRSRIPGRAAGLVASIAFGAIAGFGMLGGGLAYGADAPARSVLAVSDWQQSTPDSGYLGSVVFTPFDSQWG